jgi:hypothetical protein
MSFARVPLDEAKRIIGALDHGMIDRMAEKLAALRANGLSVVGRDGGYTAKVGDAVCIIPTVNPDAVTPHSEAFQAVIWHLLVSHPSLKARQTKWEGVETAPAHA